MSQPPSRFAAELAFVVQAARPGFWLTAIWFYFVPVGGQRVLGQGEFWAGLLYVTFPLGVLLYGWNDLVDAETDRLNPRKDTFLFGGKENDTFRMLSKKLKHASSPLAGMFLIGLSVGFSAGFAAFAWLMWHARLLGR